MRNNLTKKEVQQVPAFELALRFNYLLEKAETVPLKEITMADARETVWIEEELRKKLIKLLGRDFYPPDRVEKKAPSNYMISLLKSRQDKPEEKIEGQFGFKITITSSIGSKVAEQNVKVDSKSDAEIEAHKIIKRLGLKKATYKIS